MIKNTNSTTCPYCGKEFTPINENKINILLKPGYQVCCNCDKTLIYKKEQYGKYQKKQIQSTLKKLVLEVQDTQVTAIIKLAKKINELIDTINFIIEIEDIDA